MSEIIIKKDSNNKPYCIVKGGNGEPVFWSESYSSLEAALYAANWIKKNAPAAPIRY